MNLNARLRESSVGIMGISCTLIIRDTAMHILSIDCIRDIEAEQRDIEVDLDIGIEHE